MTPREFYERFTKPAVEHWKVNQHVEHLAVHALSQIAILAEVGAQHFGKDYLRELESRREVLRVIRDAHNSHKHGWPRNEKERKSFKQGQRVTKETSFGNFAGHTFIGGPPTKFHYVGLMQDDGEPIKVASLIFEAMRAWDSEFETLGI
jgi:hypothetical protein